MVTFNRLSNWTQYSILTFVFGVCNFSYKFLKIYVKITCFKDNFKFIRLKSNVGYIKNVREN